MFNKEQVRKYPRIKELRKAHKMTQQMVADSLHTSQSLYAYYELGRRAMSLETLIDLAILYNVSTDYILGLTNNPNPK